MKEKSLSDIANMISIRNYLWAALNGPRNLITKADVPKINTLVSTLDKSIVQDCLASTLLVSTSSVVIEDLDLAKRISEAKAQLKTASAPLMSTEETSGDQLMDTSNSAPARKLPKTRKPIKPDTVL